MGYISLIFTRAKINRRECSTARVNLQGINGLVLGGRTLKSFILFLLCARSYNKYLSLEILRLDWPHWSSCFLSQPHPSRFLYISFCLCESSRLWCMNIREEKKKRKDDSIFLTAEMSWHASSAESTVGMYNVSKNVTDIQREYPWQPLLSPPTSWVAHPFPLQLKG